MDHDKGEDEHVEVVEGKPTAKSTVLGLRVKDASTKEGKDGDPVGHLTIAGRAGNLLKLVGQECEIQTAGASRRIYGHVHEYKVTEGKKGGPNVTTLKVTGAPSLHDLGLVQVQVLAVQGELPGMETEEDEKSPPPLGELDGPGGRSKKRATRRARGRAAAAGTD